MAHDQGARAQITLRELFHGQRTKQKGYLTPQVRSFWLELKHNIYVLKNKKGVIEPIEPWFYF